MAKQKDTAAPAETTPATEAFKSITAIGAEAPLTAAQIESTTIPAVVTETGSPVEITTLGGTQPDAPAAEDAPKPVVKKVIPASTPGSTPVVVETFWT